WNPGRQKPSIPAWQRAGRRTSLGIGPVSRARRSLSGRAARRKTSRTSHFGVSFASLGRRTTIYCLVLTNPVGGTVAAGLASPTRLDAAITRPEIHPRHVL